MLTFGLLKTSAGSTFFGPEKNTITETKIINKAKTMVIPKKNTLCLCFGDINTTAIFNKNVF
jgi:hypothetical protein